MPDQHGGYTLIPYCAAELTRALKIALVVLPTPNAAHEPELIDASNIDEVVAGIGQTFNIKLSKLNGSTQMEEFAIRTYDDLEIETLTNQSTVLAQQKTQAEFLHQFHDQLSSNPTFKSEVDELLQNKKALVTFLKALKMHLQSVDDTTLMNLLEL